MHTDNSPRHLFVSGPARSGTTLLRLVLSAHPAISITPECSFFYPLMTSPHFWNRVLSKTEILKITRCMKADEKLKNWNFLSFQEIIEKIESHHHLTAQALLDLIFYEYSDNTSSETTYVGNKKGIYATAAGPFMKALLPDSRFIFIIRDPRDTVRSMKKAWGRTYKDAAVTYNVRLHFIDLICRKFSNDCLVIKYEDLVATTKQTCVVMCDFLNVKFNDAMLHFYKGNEKGQRLVQTRLTDHTNTFSTFNKDLIGQWRTKNDLTPLEIRGIENICRSNMLKYGYELSEPHSRINVQKFSTYPLFFRRTCLARLKYRLIYSLNYIRKARYLLIRK